MATLLRSEADATAPDVLVFGSGTIGRPILQRLRRRNDLQRVTVPVPWADPDGRARAVRQVAEAVGWGTGAGPRPLRVVWAAGRAGFGATGEQVEQEFAAYEDVVALAVHLGNTGRSSAVELHLVSSAGGLFEGQAVRSATTSPRPLRDYGRLKQRQEEHALDALSEAGTIIYRPSSVYAAPTGVGRPGLVGTLVGNGIAHRVTSISGELATLRDYVLADDVGNYVADRLISPHPARRGVHMLVAGRAASILEVIAGVEFTIRRRVYVRVVASSNASNITFSPAARAPGFTGTSLLEGIQRVFASSLGSLRPLSRRLAPRQ